MTKTVMMNVKLHPKPSDNLSDYMIVMAKKSLREIYWILMGLQPKYDLYEECLHF